MEVDFLPVQNSHVNHDSKWLLPGAQPQFTLCLPCLLESLEDDDISLNKKNFILAEIKGMTRNPVFLRELSDNPHIAAHMITVFSEFVYAEAKSVVATATDGILTLTSNLQNPELTKQFVELVSQKMMQMRECQYREHIAMFHVLGRLVLNYPHLSAFMLQQLGEFVDYLCAGLDCPDEQLQSTLLQIFIQLYNENHLISPKIHHSIAVYMLQFITNAKLRELTVSAIELLKKFLMNKNLTAVLMSTGTGDNLTLPVVLKKALISCQSEIVKVSIVQCILQLLGIDESNKYTDQLLDADIAEFLYEAFATNNDKLLGMIFHCLNMMTASRKFFVKCHCVYGMEPMLLGIEQSFQYKNREAIIAGLILFDTILLQHKEGIRLFSNLPILKRSLKLLNDGVTYGKSDISNIACDALAKIFVCHHMPGVIPLRDIMVCLQEVCALSSQYSQPIKQRNTGKIEPIEQYCRHLFLSLNNATRLLLDQSIPCEETTFVAPSKIDSTDNALGYVDFLRFIKSTINDVVIPLFTLHWESLNEESTTRLFVCLASQVYRFPVAVLDQWSIQLVSGDFISFLLDLKQKHRPVIDCKFIDELLYIIGEDLFVHHHPSTNWSVFSVPFRSGLSNVAGSLYNIDDLCNRDGSIDAATAHMYLLYLSLFYQPNSYEIPLLMKVIHFIHQFNDLSSSSDATLVHITYILSLFIVNVKGFKDDVILNQYCSASERLAGAIANSRCLEMWKTMNSQIVAWCFSHQKVSGLLGKNLICVWMENDFPLEPVRNFIKQDRLIIHTILDVISSSEDERLVRKGTGLIFYLLNEEVSEDTLLSDVEECVAGILQRLLLRHDSNKIPGENIRLLVNILNMTKLRQNLEKPPSSRDLKLVHHVLNVLELQNALGSDDYAPYVHLLLIALIQSVLASDKQVSYLITVRKNALQRIIDWFYNGNDNIRLITQYILCCLIESDAKVESLIYWPFQTLMKDICSKQRSVKLCTIHLLSLIFQTHNKSFIRLQTSKNSDRRTGDQMIVTDIRQLYFLLQQAFFQDDELFSILSLQCITQLKLYSSIYYPKLGSHLHSQAWNEFLFQHVSTSHQNLSNLLLLASLFDDQHRFDSKFISKLTQTLRQHAQDSDDKIIAYSLIAEKILNVPCSPISKQDEDLIRIMIDQERDKRVNFVKSVSNSIWYQLLRLCLDN